MPLTNVHKARNVVREGPISRGVCGTKAMMTGEVMNLGGLRYRNDGKNEMQEMHAIKCGRRSNLIW